MAKSAPAFATLCADAAKVLATVSQSLALMWGISSAMGTLSALSPAAVATGTTPASIAIRSDDNWLFVTNYNSASISQYSITPATGALNPATTAITTDNFPLGVAVK